MNFNLTLSGKQYSETIQEGDAWGKPTIINRQSIAVGKDHNGLVGICQLTDLFFNTVQQNAGRSIQHSNEIVLSENNSYVHIKLDNQREIANWKECSSVNQHTLYCGEISTWIQITTNPQ